MIGVYIKQFDEMTYDYKDDVYSASITIYVLGTPSNKKTR